MNPFFAEGAPLAMPLRKLLGAMGNPRASHIVLVTADDETVRQETMAELAERLSGAYSLHEFDYADPPTMSLPRFCRALSGDGAVCVFAYGLDVLAVRDEKKYQEALHFLNAHREDVRYSHSSVVLWLTSRSLADLREQAPDFADWQNAGARFALPRAQRIERTPLGRLSIAEAEQIRGQVRRFREMLKRPNLEAAMAAELRKQLDVAERRLGRIVDVRRDYRLHLADELREHVLRGFAPQVGGRVLSLPLAKIFLPLKALEGRPPLAEYAAEALHRPEPEGELDELGRQPRGPEGVEVEKGRARLEVRQAAQRPLRLEELLKEPRAVLLGDPGSGKTTVTRYAAYALATGDPTHIGPAVGGLLPVLVRLANFGEALAAEPELTLVDYVGSRLMPQPAFGSCLREAIEAGQCLVILDGLDEITDPQLRIAVTARIEALVHAWGGNRFLVTSRIVGYERSPLTRDFQHATLCELTTADRERFVELWYAAIKAEIRDRSLAAREAELLEALRDKPQIARMAANPLLLTIMVLMHWRGVKLPSRRVQVYQIATDTLIEYWTAERVRLDSEEVKQILAPIAHRILSSHVGGVIAQRDLLPRLRAGIAEQRGCQAEEAERLADELLVLLGEQSGIFLECGLDPEGRPVYGFLHQTFGEYLAALQLAGEVLAGDFELSRYIHRSAWREPLLLLAGHLALFSQAHAGKLLRSILDFPCPWEGILHRNVLLAADCLADDVQVPPALRDETLRELAELLVNPAGQVREAAAELCQRLAATRYRAPAAAMVKTLPDRPGLDLKQKKETVPGVVTALVSLGERDAAAPLIDLLRKEEGQKLRFEGWPEKADDLLAEWLDSGDLSVRFGRDLATCTFGALSAERIRERLGDEGFPRFLEQGAARYPALSLSLQWVTALASDPPASEKIRQLLSPKSSRQIRRWAAIHLLGSEHRATAITALQELSSEGNLKATEALVEADPETVVDWTPARRAVFRGHRDAVLAIRLLLKGGQIDTGVALLYYLLATEPAHLIVQLGRPTQPFRALAADLVSARRAELVVALARWLALRPGEDHRVSACEVLLALGETEEAIRLLSWAACECHGDVSRLACERLLALGEAELAVPILGRLAASERPDLRYQAALALALANRASEQLDEVTRIRLKTDILADRRRAYRSSLDQLYHAGIAALPETGPSNPDLSAVTTLARVSLGWLSGREPWSEETAAIPAKFDHIEADVATALCMIELRRGRLEPGTSRLLTLAKRSDLPPWVRLWVLKLFGLIHCRNAISLLRQAFEDPEPSVRETAVEALAQLNLEENADILVLALRDPDPWVREVATEGVTKTRDPHAVEALLELLSDKERNIRDRAIDALALIGNPEAVRGLIRAFEDEDRDPHERGLVIDALIQVADRSGREALAGALSSNDPWLPVAAGAALATQGDSRGCEVLVAALGSEDQWLRNSAADALVTLTDPALTPRLIRLLSHEDAQVRSKIASVLGRRADPAAAPALTRALADEDSRVRANAALTLGWFEHVPAMSALIGLLGDETEYVRRQAVLALGFLPAPIDVFLEALGDDDFQVRRAALQSLGRSNDPAAGRALLAALEHEDAMIRSAAANALERRGSIEAVPALIRALGDESHVVRQNAAAALGGLRDRRALRPLTALLNDSAEDVCEAAAAALGRLQDRAAVDPLIQVLEDIHSRVGSAAVKALGRIGDSAAVPPLIAMVGKLVERGGYNKKFLAPIAQALARLNAVEAVPLLVAIAVPEPEYLSALVHLDAGKALELLDRFATPLRLASWRQRLRGQALWQLGDPDAALLCFREAVSEHAQNVDNHLALVHFHLERGELEGAMEHLERVPRKWESYGLRLLTRAVVVHRRGEAERAAVDYELVCREYPELIDHEDLKYEHFWRPHAVAALRELQERAGARSTRSQYPTIRCRPSSG